MSNLRTFYDLIYNPEPYSE